MWTVVYIAQSRVVAEELKSELEKTGVLVRLQACKCAPGAAETQPFCEISVTSADVEKAHDFIIEHGF